MGRQGNPKWLSRVIRPCMIGTISCWNEKRVLALLDRAIAPYTGHDKPVEAWKHIVPGRPKVHRPQDQRARRQGHLHPRRAGDGHCERLQQAGVKPGNIVVWDRNARDLEACGLTINTDPSRVRCFGSDVAGFEDQPCLRRGERQAFEDSHSRVRHGDRSAHSQGSRAVPASPSP